MALKMDILRRLTQRYPEGFESMVRYGLHLALDLDPFTLDVEAFVPRLTVLNHENSFGEIRLDYRSPTERGQIVFVLGFEEPGDLLSHFAAVRPTYFGDEAEHHVTRNLLRLRFPPEPVSFRPTGNENAALAPPFSFN